MIRDASYDITIIVLVLIVAYDMCQTANGIDGRRT